MPLGGGGNAAGQATAAEQNRQKLIDAGMQTINKDFSTFTPATYKQAATDYTQYATPKAMDEYRNTKNNLAYSLAQNGLSNSGVAAQRGASLNRELNTNLGTIANQAQDQSNRLQQNVSSQKSQVISQLESSADPSAAQVEASSAVAGLRAPPAFQPLGNMFSDWTNTYLANMNAQTYQPGTQSIWSMLSGGGGYGNGTGGQGSAVMTP